MLYDIIFLGSKIVGKENNNTGSKLRTELEKNKII